MSHATSLQETSLQNKLTLLEILFKKTSSKNSAPLVSSRVERECTFTAEIHRFRRYLLLSLVARQSPGIDRLNVLLWRPNIWALLS